MTLLAKRLPYRFYFLPIMMFSIVGAVSSLYLAYAHYQNFTNPTYSSFCAISRSINCDTVAQSTYAVLWGLPVAVWGLIGYISFSVLLIPLRRPSEDYLPVWAVAVLFSGCFALSAIYFGYISITKIHAYCILCLLTYGLNFGLFLGSWFIRRRFRSASLLTDTLASGRIILSMKWPAFAISSILVVAILLAVWMPPYWSLSAGSLDDEIAFGVTDAGYPWIGAEKPEVTIHVFSDYMCFQCKKMHYYLRQLVAQYPDKIRLVHRHFPMDRNYNPLVSENYHSGSGKMALISLYALEKGHFWKVNDLLFNLASKKQDFSSRIIADQMGIENAEIVTALDHKYLRLRLKHDIAVGINRGITGTPSFIIDDAVYTGTIPRDLLQKRLAENES